MEKQALTFNGQMSTLKDNAMSFLGDLTTGLSDIAKNEALPFINEQLVNLQNAFKKGGFKLLSMEFTNVIENITKKFAEAIPVIWDLAGDIVTGIVFGVGQNLDVVEEVALKIMVTFIDVLTTSLPQLIFTAAAIIKGFAEAIGGMSGDLAEGAISLIMAFLNAIIWTLPVLIPAWIQLIDSMIATLTSPETITSIIATAFQIITTLASAITSVLPTLIPAAVQTIITIINALIDNIPMLIDASIAMMEGLADGILDALPIIIDAVPEIILSLIDAIIENLPKILESGAEIIVALATGLIKAIPQLLAAVPDIFIALVKAFGALAPKMWQAGKDIVGGIWEGIESAWGTLVDNFTRSMRKLVSSVKKTLGINSPSTVMKEIFVNFVAGGDVGLDQEFPDFEKKVTKQYGGLFSGIRAESAVTPAAAVAGGNNVLQLITPVQIDGREVARTTAEYTGQQLSWLQ